MHGVIFSYTVYNNYLCNRLGCNDLGDKGTELIGKALQANASKTVKQIMYLSLCSLDMT